MDSAEQRLLAAYCHTEEARKEAEARLSNGEPLAYILGEQYFYNEVYTVTPDVLIPRPDTEHLVEQVIRRTPRGVRFLDLCTGSGCVAISVLANRPDLTAVAIDKSPAALRIAAQNAERNGVADRLTLLTGDVTVPCPEIGAFAVICANPPYIDSTVVDTLSEQVRREPRMALDGGKDGMDLYRAILQNYVRNLEPDGIFLFEIGYDQKEKITSLAAACRPAFLCEVFRDYGGNDRVAFLSRQVPGNNPESR